VIRLKDKESSIGKRERRVLACDSSRALLLIHLHVPSLSLSQQSFCLSLSLSLSPLELLLSREKERQRRVYQRRDHRVRQIRECEHDIHTLHVKIEVALERENEIEKGVEKL
jgi:hypothetical protein